MDKMGYIRPLGSMLDGHVTPVDHVYVAPKSRSVADNTYPVLMPADGEVVDVGRMPDQYIGDRADVKLAQEDHRLTLRFSCRYYSIYIHVHKLEGDVAKAASDLQAGASKKTNIELKAGDTIGYIGGDTFDWTPIDVKTTLKGFISPALYQGESWKVHTVSPFDLYTGDLKAQMEAKSLRTTKPVGGKIDYDEKGKLVGSWFREGTNGYSGSDQSRYWDGHLSVVPDYIDPSTTIVSIGNWDGTAKQFMVSSSVDPSKISKTDGIVKYELKSMSYLTKSGSAWDGNSLVQGLHGSPSGSVAGTIVFEVQDGEKLKVEKFIGKSASQVEGFTSAAQTYER
jgi:hypothetical protein